MIHVTGVKGSWAEQKGTARQKSTVKQKIAAMINNDMLFGEGTIEELFRKLQIKFGKTKEEFQAIIAAL